MVKRIHHINFIVKDLDEGIQCYEKILGEGVFEKDELPQRGVLTARAKVAEQWFVLVQPTDFALVPGKHLMEHGEGFFLLSFEVDDMNVAISQMEDKGLSFTKGADRKGLANWWVRDLDKTHTHDVQVQLCEERD